MSLAENRFFDPNRGEAVERIAVPAPQKTDPLTDALLYLAAHHGRALSRDALLTGLPITDGKLTVALFERAAQRAGLEVQAVKRPFAEIAALVLPAVLVMRDGTTRILLANHADPERATVIDPSVCRPDAHGHWATILRTIWDTRSLPAHATTADPRTVAAGELPKKHWFWSVVARFWSNYSHVAIAAFIVNILALASPLFIMNVYDRVVPNGAIASLIALSHWAAHRDRV